MAAPQALRQARVAPQLHPRGPRPRRGQHSLGVGPSIATVTLNPTETTPCRQATVRCPPPGERGGLPPRPSSLRLVILAGVQRTGTGITRRPELTPMAARPLADRATAALRRRGVGTGLSDLFQGCLLPPLQYLHLYVTMFKSGQGANYARKCRPSARLTTSSPRSSDCRGRD